MSSVPTNFLTGNDNWWVAIRMSRVNSADDQGWSICDGGANGAGIAWRPRGDYFMRNSTSNYLINCALDTPARSNIWVIFQWDDDNSRYDAWVDGNRELDQAISTAPTATTPSSVSWLRTVYSSNYFYNFRGSVSAIIMGNGQKLTSTEAETMSGNLLSYADLDATVQAKTTNAWSFSSTSVVTDLGAITLTPEVGTGGAYELVLDTYAAPVPYLVDGALTVNNDTTGDFDLSSVLVNNGDVAVTYSKVSGDSWFGAPDSSTGILTVDADTQAAGDYTAVYRITHSEGTDDMTLTATVTALTTILSEDFEGGIGSWTIADDAASINQWELGTATAEGGTSSMYVSDDSGTTNTYTNNDATIAHVSHVFVTPSDITAGVSLDFSWKCQGQSSYDFLSVFVVPVTTVPVGGTENLSTYNIIGTSGKYNQSGSWNNESVDISSLVLASTAYRIVFQWKNDGSGGAQPPAGIDNISIVA